MRGNEGVGFDTIFTGIKSLGGGNLGKSGKSRCTTRLAHIRGLPRRHLGRPSKHSARGPSVSILGAIGVGCLNIVELSDSVVDRDTGGTMPGCCFCCFFCVQTCPQLQRAMPTAALTCVLPASASKRFNLKTHYYLYIYDGMQR